MKKIENEVQALADELKEVKKELEWHKTTIGTFIAWSSSHLGVVGVHQLLDILNGKEDE